MKKMRGLVFSVENRDEISPFSFENLLYKMYNSILVVWELLEFGSALSPVNVFLQDLRVFSINVATWGEITHLPPFWEG